MYTFWTLTPLSLDSVSRQLGRGKVILILTNIQMYSRSASRTRDCKLELDLVEIVITSVTSAIWLVNETEARRLCDKLVNFQNPGVTSSCVTIVSNLELFVPSRS